MGSLVRPVGMLLLLGAACSRAPLEPQPPSIQCVPRGLGAAGLTAEWQRFAAHIHACVVIDPRGIPALEILTVSAQSFYNAQPPESMPVTLPRPAILLPGGQLAGRLPYNYPDDPPWTTTLEFSRWHTELPERIAMRVHGRAVTEEHDVVLQWDVTARRYAAMNPR